MAHTVISKLISDKASIICFEYHHELSVERWANHIIKRFGKDGALVFAKYKGTQSCPCYINNWECEKCEHLTSASKPLYRIHFGCKKAREWQFIGFNKINDIKRKILEKFTVAVAIESPKKDSNESYIGGITWA